MKGSASSLVLLVALAVMCLVSVLSPPPWPASSRGPAISTNGPPGHTHPPCLSDMTDDEACLAAPAALQGQKTVPEKQPPTADRFVVVVPASTLVLRL